MSRTLRLDAGTGARLLAAGIDPMFAAVDRPGVLRALHQADLEAGAEALTAATFSAPNGAPFDRAVAIALSLAKGRTVFASLGPFGSANALKERARRAFSLGADYVVLETFTRMPLLLDAVRALAGERVIASYCPIMQGGERADGIDPAVLRDAGAYGLGVNCGTGFEQAGGFEAFIDHALALQAFERPVYARPSAGLRGQIAVERFAQGLKRLEDHGVDFVGGCCAVGPRHLKAAYGESATAIR